MKHQTDPHRAHPDTVLGILEWHLAGGCSSSIHGLVQQLREQCRVQVPSTQAELDAAVAAKARAWALDERAHCSVYEELVRLCELRPEEASGPAGAAAKESSDIAAPAVAAKVEDPLPCPGCGRPMYRVGGPGAHRGWTCVNCNAAGDPEEDHPDARPCGCEDSVALNAQLAALRARNIDLALQLSRIRKLARALQRV